jgi:hypothetical protein
MERFWSKVDKTESCWNWTASKNTQGYGGFKLNGKVKKAHRVAYELTRGHIPDGLVLDHLCRNHSCVNPDHLEPVTHRENTIRGVVGEMTRNRQLSKTHCRRGHEYTEENTYVSPKGDRTCKSCRNYRARKLRLKQKEIV